MSRQVQLEDLQEPPQQLGHLKSLLAGGLPGVFTDKALIVFYFPFRLDRAALLLPAPQLTQQILREPKCELFNISPVKC